MGENGISAVNMLTAFVVTIIGYVKLKKISRKRKEERQAYLLKKRYRI
jgi:hypothetical protein